MLIEAKHLERDFTVYNQRSSFHMLHQMLRRKGEKRKVVKDISLKIDEGEFVGYLGPNGAGKSTTIKMLSGVLSPSAGSIQVMGLDPVKDRKKHAKNIGVLYGQRTQLWWDLPLMDSFKLLTSIYQVPERLFKQRLNQFIEMLEMENFLYTPVRQLSLGQRMKGEVVATLIHNPKIVFLDEPTIGLDILAKKRIQKFLKYLNEEHNTTILLTSHNIDDVDQLCKRIILIDNGEIKFDGPKEKLSELTNSEKTLAVEVEPLHSDTISTFAFKPAEVRGNTLYFHIADDADVPEMITNLSKHYNILKIEISEVDIEKILEEVYTSKQYKIVN
ncbi:ABC transporter ATP-binding protein [Bacillus halotolerans]|uniref:ABC transporter ATP-binding protein n=1 Tax=Bacillus halotolerans TaxID=260554 RepID=UPI00403F8B56